MQEHSFCIVFLVEFLLQQASFLLSRWAVSWDGLEFVFECEDLASYFPY